MRGRASFPILKALLGLVLCPSVFGAESDVDWDAERDLSGLISPSVLIADAATGARLFAKGENRRMPPASLAKLMTLYLIHEDLERGAYSQRDIITVPLAGAADAMRPASSVLGLSAGDRVSILTLMRAAAVRSAGDAAWTLALHAARGRPADSFVDRMNRTAVRLGMGATLYTDPDGWSEKSLTTPSDQLTLILSYIRRFPAAPAQIHSLKEMVFLDGDKIRRRSPDASGGRGGSNTNFLIGRTPGADGLKTGTLPESGFHLAATALRGESRFIAIVMGINTGSAYKSLELRADEAEACLEWAFSRYVTWHPRLPGQTLIPVRRGASENIPALPLGTPPPITLTREQHRGLIVVLNLNQAVIAPVEAGRPLGSAAWYSGGRLLLRTPLAASEPVPRKWKLRDIFKAPPRKAVTP